MLAVGERERMDQGYLLSGAIVMAMVALFVLLMPRQPPLRAPLRGKGVTEELLVANEGGVVSDDE